MKLVLVLALFAAVAYSQEAAPAATKEIKLVPKSREIPADVLRDFPGVCFASTSCRTFKVDEEWELKPFCGKSKCLKGEDGRLMEKVEDCGPLPKPNPKCKVSEATNVTASFPDCCPTFICDEGIELEFPEFPIPSPAA